MTFNTEGNEDATEVAKLVVDVDSNQSIYGQLVKCNMKGFYCIKYAVSFMKVEEARKYATT